MSTALCTRSRVEESYIFIIILIYLCLHFYHVLIINCHSFKNCNACSQLDILGYKSYKKYNTATFLAGKFGQRAPASRLIQPQITAFPPPAGD